MGSLSIKSGHKTRKCWSGWEEGDDAVVYSPVGILYFNVSQHHHVGILQRRIKKAESDISKALYRPRARNKEE